MENIDFTPLLPSGEAFGKTEEAYDLSPIAEESGITRRADGRLFISPRAKNLALESAVDMTKVIPTGPNERVIERDIARALEEGYVSTQADVENFLAGIMPLDEVDVDGDGEEEENIESAETVAESEIIESGEENEVIEESEPDEADETVEATEAVEEAESIEEVEPTEIVEADEPSGATEEIETIEEVEPIEKVENDEPSETVEEAEFIEEVEPIETVETVESSETIEEIENIENDEAVPEPEPEYVDEPLKTTRTSLSEMTSLTISSSFNAASVLALRAKLKSAGCEMGLNKITLTDMILFAVSRVLTKYSVINANLIDGVIRRYKNANVALAVDTDGGLFTPVIYSADRLSLFEISSQAKDSAEKARAGELPDWMCGSFTVINLGSLGVESFTPVITPPQTAALGVCCVTNRLDGEGKVYPAIGLSLTFDHRAVDGVTAAEFLKELCTSLANYDLLLCR